MPINPITVTRSPSEVPPALVSALALSRGQGMVKSKMRNSLPPYLLFHLFKVDG